MSIRNLTSWILLASLGMGLGIPIQAEDGPAKAPAPFEKLTYRSIGPATGGRVSRVAGVPGDPLTYYAATSAGGVWKSTDGGNRFQPIFDDQPVSSIGSIAVAPSDPNVVYVGTGEANIRGNVAAGVGIFVSTDAGKSWNHSWKEIGQIGTIAVHPKKPEVAFAAVLGHAFGPNPERGIYRTLDTGKTWEKVLFVNKDTGASDVCIDPTNPRIIYAGFWQTRRLPWEMTSGGPGSALYVSRDMGETWQKLGPGTQPKKKAKEKPKSDEDEGLPPGPWGRVGIAVAPSDGHKVYAIIEAEKGGLFRSEDGGSSWSLVSDNRAIRQRAWYYSTLTVDPTNPDIVWCPQVTMLKSIDGGRNFERIDGFHHGDHHDLWIDPANPRRMIAANDGGVDISTDGGKTWSAPALPIAQFYHINCDTRFPYRVMGNMQDQGTASGPSHSLKGGGIPLLDWHGVGGGETGFSVPDPRDPAIVYSGEYGGIITRFDERTRQARNVSIYPFNPSGHGAEDLRIRFQWTSPIVVSRHQPGLVYHAGNHLFRSKTGGQTWEMVSPDLTRNDRNKMKWSGGPITGDNTTVEVYGTIFALAESPKQAGILWAGTDDGLVHISKDEGKTWQDVTKNIPGLPDWATIRCIEASPHDAGTAYLVADAHRLDNYHPYLWKTSDFGKTWTQLGEELDPDVYLHVVREDPVKKGQLYLGSERKVLFSRDDGETFEPLQLNMPTVAIHDLHIHQNDLVVGTNGRSIWILDDLTPLREWTEGIAAAKAHLFPIRPAIKWSLSGLVSAGQAVGTGENPDYGAVFQYLIKEKPKTPPTLEIKDASGKQVIFWDGKNHKKEKADRSPDGNPPEIRTPEIPAEAGLNKFVWDLEHAPPTLIQGAKVDMGNPAAGPTVSPGAYTVILTIDGQTLTGKFEVWADPRLIHKDPILMADKVNGTIPANLLQDLKAQEAFGLRLRDDISRLSAIVNRQKAMKKQLVLHRELLKDKAEAKAWNETATQVMTKLDQLEEKFHNPKAVVGYDILAMRGGAKLYSQLAWLYALTLDGDGPPTQGVMEVTAEMEKQLAELTAEWEKFLREDVTKLQGLAGQAQLPQLWIPK